LTSAFHFSYTRPSTQLLRQLTLNGSVPVEKESAEVAAPPPDSSALQGAKSGNASASGSRVTSSASMKAARQTVLAMGKARVSGDAVAQSRDRNVGVAVAASVGVLALLSVILRKQLARLLIVIFAALRNTLFMAVTRS